MGLNQYSIILVCLDPTIGSEMKKTRPCVVLSPMEMNQHLNTVIIAPMTSSIKKYPTRVSILFSNKKGSIALDQIKTIDKGRVIKVLGELNSKEIRACKKVLQQMLVDD